MRLLQLDITALSPLVFPERKLGTQFRRSLNYIPGATIYGALGQLLGMHWENVQQPFDEELFYNIRCHNAYPAWTEDAWIRPLPATAERPKGDDRTPPRDMLVDRVCWEQLEPAGMIFSPTDENGRAWESARGFRALPVQWDIRQQMMRGVQQRVLTRVSINRRRGTAEDQLLYSPLALSEVNERRIYRWGNKYPHPEEADVQQFATRFLGSVVLPESYENLGDQLQKIERLGGRVTTGLGCVQIQPRDQQTETVEDIKKRMQQLTDLFQERAALYQKLGGNKPWKNGTFFSVDLLSDAILYENGWHPTMVLTGEMLQEAADLSVTPTLVRSFASYAYAGGWNVKWDQPKPGEVSTLMGSVFLFSVENDPNDADLERLADLQLWGIGERCAEGYGQIRICDEFHVDNAF